MTVYGFNDPLVATNSRDKALQDPPRSSGRRAFMVQNFVFLIQAPSGGIPARVGVIPGKAMCTVVLVNNDDQIEDMLNYVFPGNPPLQIDVYNCTTEDVPGNEIVTAEIIGDKPCVADLIIPPCVLTTVGFLTLEKMVDREVLVVITYVGGGDCTGFEIGDQLTVTDPYNLWPQIEQNASGMAYRREPDDPNNPGRFEIESCSLPVSRITGRVTQCLFHEDLDAVVHFGAAATPTPVPDWNESTYPNQDDPPEVTVASVNDFSITALNTCHFDCPPDTDVWIERRQDGPISDPGNLDVPKVKSATVASWQIVRVCETIARYALFEKSGSLWLLQSFWDGGDPIACTIPVVCRLACPCLDDGDQVIACYDPKANEYVIISSESALLGPPDDVTVVTGVGVAGCGISFTNQPLKAFKCGADGGGGVAQLPVTPIRSFESLYTDGSEICVQYSTVFVVACGTGSGGSSCIDICPILCLCEEIYSLPEVCDPPPPPPCNCEDCFFVAGPTSIQITFNGDSQGTTDIQATSSNCEWLAVFDDLGDPGNTVAWTITYSGGGTWSASGPWPGLTDNGTALSLIDTNGTCSGASNLAGSGATGTISADGVVCETPCCCEGCDGKLVFITDLDGGDQFSWGYVQTGPSVCTDSSGGNCSWTVPITVSEDGEADYEDTATVTLTGSDSWDVSVPLSTVGGFDGSWSATIECNIAEHVDCVTGVSECNDNVPGLGSFDLDKTECPLDPVP